MSEKNHQSITAPPQITILVDGRFNVGKTAFIRSLSDMEVRSTEKTFSHGRLAVDFGKMTLSNKQIYFFGIPGPLHFLRIDECVSVLGLDGAILVIDSRFQDNVVAPSYPLTAQELAFPDAQYMSRYYADHAPVPYVIAANRQDQPGAASAEEVRAMLRVPANIPVVPCVATDKESCKKVLLTLLDLVLEADEA